ncbi:MAG: hypothetical protein IT384_24855 [Deltaproteobacteria bacterium]|nr:hypothetical protein [Deltaproteobacteria bacterium]
MIEIPPIRDARPVEEKEGADDITMRFLLPLFPLWWTQWTAGVEREDATYLGGGRLVAELWQGLVKTVAASRLCRMSSSEDAPTHRLEVTLQHLYSLFYADHFFSVSLSGGHDERLDFYPAAQAAMQLRLVPLSTEHAAVDFMLSAQVLFDEPVEGKGAIDPAGEPHNVKTDRRTWTAVQAVRGVLLDLPAALDAALAEAGANSAPWSHDEVIVVRLLEDYDHLEVAHIELETGLVRSSAIVERTEPVFSAPGEWVVSRYQPQYLPAGEYAALVEILSPTFDVGFEENLSAAYFRGVRFDLPGARVPATLGESESNMAGEGASAGTGAFRKKHRSKKGAAASSTGRPRRKVRRISASHAGLPPG